MAKKKSETKVPQPPEPPQIGRRLVFHPLQAIGVPLIMLIPLLALLGVFGRATTEASERAANLEVKVEHPTRMRYKTTETVEIAVRNAGGGPLDSVNVVMDREYLEGFSNVSFTPTADEITDEGYVVELGAIEPGSTRIVSVEIRGDQYWLHEGGLTVGEVSIPLATWVFP